MKQDYNIIITTKDENGNLQAKGYNRNAFKAVLSQLSENSKR